MNVGFDIFKKLADGSPLWVGKADTLNHARQSVELISRSAPGQYFIRDAATGMVIPDVPSSGAGLGES
ncbi:MAG TPA: hypothetical protein VGI16_03205 [Candidatus Acidoferrum sp.]|jgi:hypothetical protein